VDRPYLGRREVFVVRMIFVVVSDGESGEDAG
jgi:hypothetical protein